PHPDLLSSPTRRSSDLVLTSAIISIVVGVPLGILCAQNNRVQSVVTPVLDFMQTMPAFVYLIPAVTFFSLGSVPGVIASVIFAIDRKSTRLNSSHVKIS